MRKAIYFALPLVFCSCANNGSSDLKPSLLERIVTKVSQSEPPQIDEYPSGYQRALNDISTKEVNEPDNFMDLFYLEASQENIYGEDIDDPHYAKGLKLPQKICEEAFKDSAEEMVKDYFKGSAAESTFKKISEAESDWGNISFKPGLYHGELYLKGLFELKDLKLFSKSFGKFEAEIGTLESRLRFVKPFGGFQFIADYQVKNDHEGFIFGIRKTKRSKNFTSDLNIFAGHGRSRYSFEEKRDFSDSDFSFVAFYTLGF
ncbi:MAG: hypothetical protein WC548_03050 [Candidatus Pacearchaeota archaeon]